MPNSTNSNAAGMENLSDKGPDGTSVGTVAADLTGEHGVVSAQIANITIVTGSFTTNKTQLADEQSVAINALISAMTNKGRVADV